MAGTGPQARGPSGKQLLYDCDLSPACLCWLQQRLACLGLSGGGPWRVAPERARVCVLLPADFEPGGPGVRVTLPRTARCIPALTRDRAGSGQGTPEVVEASTACGSPLAQP